MILQIGKEDTEQEKILNFWLERTISGNVMLQSRERSSNVEYTEAIIGPQGTIELVRFGKLDHVNNEAAYTEDDIKEVVSYLVTQYIEPYCVGDRYVGDAQMIEELVPKVLGHLKKE